MAASNKKRGAEAIYQPSLCRNWVFRAQIMTFVFLKLEANSAIQGFQQLLLSGVDLNVFTECSSVHWITYGKFYPFFFSLKKRLILIQEKAVVKQHRSSEGDKHLVMGSVITHLDQHSVTFSAPISVIRKMVETLIVKSNIKGRLIQVFCPQWNDNFQILHIELF